MSGFTSRRECDSVTIEYVQNGFNKLNCWILKAQRLNSDSAEKKQPALCDTDELTLSGK